MSSCAHYIHVLLMSSCAHSPSERMCWIVKGGEERCGERCVGRCRKVFCGVGEMRGGRGSAGGGVKRRIEGGVGKCVGV